MPGPAAPVAALRALALPQIEALAGALEAGGAAWPAALALGRAVTAADGAAVGASLAALSGSGMAPGHVALLLRAVADERRQTQRVSDRVSLVWTGPEVPGAESRDTEVVVGELFAKARQRVLVAGYVVHDGRSIFAGLARRMGEVPGLQVSVYLNVARGSDARPETEIVRAFGERFVTEHWPTDAARLPALYYDPRSLATEAASRAVLHAKCVAVDDGVALVTSANLTGAAQRRNIEAGVLVEDRGFARRLRWQLEALAERGILRRVPFPERT